MGKRWYEFVYVISIIINEYKKSLFFKVLPALERRHVESTMTSSSTPHINSICHGFRYADCNRNALIADPGKPLYQTGIY
jgi:hypothetical protein